MKKWIWILVMLGGCAAVPPPAVIDAGNISLSGWYALDGEAEAPILVQPGESAVGDGPAALPMAGTVVRLSIDSSSYFVVMPDEIQVYIDGGYSGCVKQVFNEVGGISGETITLWVYTIKHSEQACIQVERQYTSRLVIAGSFDPVLTYTVIINEKVIVRMQPTPTPDWTPTPTPAPKKCPAGKSCGQGS